MRHLEPQSPSRHPNYLQLETKQGIRVIAVNDASSRSTGATNAFLIIITPVQGTIANELVTA